MKIEPLFKTNTEISCSRGKIFGQFLAHFMPKSWKFAAFQKFFQMSDCFYDSDVASHNCRGSQK